MLATPLQHWESAAIPQEVLTHKCTQIHTDLFWVWIGFNLQVYNLSSSSHINSGLDSLVVKWSHWHLIFLEKAWTDKIYTVVVWQKKKIFTSLGCSKPALFTVLLSLRLFKVCRTKQNWKQTKQKTIIFHLNFIILDLFFYIFYYYIFNHVFQSCMTKKVFIHAVWQINNNKK